MVAILGSPNIFKIINQITDSGEVVGLTTR
jgi:hypothetical protein